MPPLAILRAIWITPHSYSLYALTQAKCTLKVVVLLKRGGGGELGSEKQKEVGREKRHMRVHGLLCLPKIY